MRGINGSFDAKGIEEKISSLAVHHKCWGLDAGGGGGCGVR